MAARRFDPSLASAGGGKEGNFILSKSQERNIEILYEIAKENGARLSLSDVLDLASLTVDEKELVGAWNHSQFLRGKYTLASGEVLEKSSPQIDYGEASKRVARADYNLRVASEFALMFENDESLEVLCVSGSTSYRSASEDDDLDFFCVTKNGSAWIFLLKALFHRRLFQMKENAEGKKLPPICFSYVMEDSCARNLFSERSDGLFARDSITAIVLKGEQVYASLLRDCRWIETYFPKIYRARLNDKQLTKHITLEKKIESAHQWQANILLRAVNGILFITLGNYIRFKSYLLNRRFARNGSNERLFKAKISKSYCLFESENYSHLRNKYAHLHQFSAQ